MASWGLRNSNGTFDLKNDFNLDVERHLGTGLPPQETITTPYGLADGSAPQRIVILERVFRLMGVIKGGTLPEYRAKRVALENELTRDAVVSISSEGVETINPVVLIYTLDGTTVEIECLYRAGLEDGSPTDGFLEKLTLEFVAYDPYFKAPSAETADLNINSNTTVANGGTARTYPILTLVGEGQVLSLANSTIGLTISFDELVVVAGETITLDLSPNEKTLSSDVRGNLNGMIAQGARLTAWHLQKGNNTILLSAQAEQTLLDEDDTPLTDESGDSLLGSNTLNLTTAQFEITKRYWSINGVAN